MSDIKSKLKKVAPQGVKDAYRSVHMYKERLFSFNYDKNRFLKYRSKANLGRNNQVQIAARLVFHAHALEKGLSHNVVRLGFGKTALQALGRNLDIYISKGYSKKDKAYLNALSVLRAYLDLHKQENFDTAYVSQFFSDEVIAEALADNSCIGGAIQVKQADKANNGEANFEKLFTNRWSVREYADTPVDKSRIDDAIRIALKTPSICNRQSSRATVLYDREKIDAALRLQGGITGYELPPVLIMITTDTSAFVGVNERNQVWIDGGLFAMSVLLALEYVSLAACPLNAMMSIKRDKKMRKLLDIPASENIIMFISVGNFLDESGVPKSFRYDVEEVSRIS